MNLHSSMKATPYRPRAWLAPVLLLVSVNLLAVYQAKNTTSLKALPPTCDGYSDVDTYRDLDFYLEIAARVPERSRVRVERGSPPKPPRRILLPA